MTIADIPTQTPRTIPVAAAPSWALSSTFVRDFLHIEHTRSIEAGTDEEGAPLSVRLVQYDALAIDADGVTTDRMPASVCVDVDTDGPVPDCVMLLEVEQARRLAAALTAAADLAIDHAAGIRS